MVWGGGARSSWRIQAAAELLGGGDGNKEEEEKVYVPSKVKGVRLFFVTHHHTLVCQKRRTKTSHLHEMQKDKKPKIFAPLIRETLSF